MPDTAFMSIIEHAPRAPLAGTKLQLNRTYGSPEDYAKAIEELRAAFPAEDVSTDPAVLEVHGRLQNYTKSFPHSVVVVPRSTEDVVRIVNISREYRMPIVAYGGATSVEGHFFGTDAKGICVDMAAMNKVLEIHEADSDLVCQPGAKWTDINAMLKEKGIPLFFPLDPGIGASIGGMISTGCSGTNAVKYGTAKGEWFLNATVVLPSGEVIKTRRRSRKCSAGFDTLRLFLGAEGTLGLVTEATLRLAPLLPTRVAVVQFPSVAHAVRASTAALNLGVNLQCIELLDALSMRALNAYNTGGTRAWPERDSLFIKIQGATPVFIDESARILRDVAERHGGTGFEFARTEAEAEELWSARKNAMHAGYAMFPGAQAFGTDVWLESSPTLKMLAHRLLSVPVSRLPELVTTIQKDVAAAGLNAPMIGHVGDGNLHAIVIYRDEEEEKAARSLVASMVKHALDLDGTCTGEHGVGLGKKKFLVEELGESTVELMKHIKQSVDPLNLFNPGKLYPD
ncbi:FAD-linked oxidase-like protein [Phanerochaete sordida]|uniref:D-lactate dehydrogenase (cytochrome) n=1 Tax=Phanerochaete sordida TaxID=48140 RepID=A0A9P3LFK8_9APHY|nr:FAD-linked oxidase-like protein [Phanerochaete sordida]